MKNSSVNVGMRAKNMHALTVNNLWVGVRQHFPTAMIQAVVQLSLSWLQDTHKPWLAHQHPGKSEEEWCDSTCTLVLLTLLEELLEDLTTPPSSKPKNVSEKWQIKLFLKSQTFLFVFAMQDFVTKMVFLSFCFSHLFSRCITSSIDVHKVIYFKCWTSNLIVNFPFLFKVVILLHCQTSL